MPSDELLVKLLVDKVKHGIEHEGVPIREHDLYGSEGPWELWSKFGGRDGEDGEDLFFFTKLRKLTLNGFRASRRLDSGGKWSEGYIRDFQTLGARMTHFLYEKEHCPHHGAWLMHEFSLGHFDARNHFHHLDDTYVLCRLKRKTPRRNHHPRQRILLERVVVNGV